MRRSIALSVGLLSACTLHHVRDEQSVPVTLSGEPASVSVEEGTTRRGAQRIFVSVTHPSFVDLEGSGPGDGELHNRRGLLIESCRRTHVWRTDLGASRRQSDLMFLCRYPLSEEAHLRYGADRVPVLDAKGRVVMGERPWILSAFVRSQLGARVTGPVGARGVDLGVNLGARGLLGAHLGLGLRGDILIDARSGRGQFTTGPEVGYVHSAWPCASCQVEASASYVLGYAQRFAHGPQTDVRFGYRFARSGTHIHGMELGVGYRHLLGPQSGGSIMFTLSYTIKTGLSWSILPAAVRAPPSQLPEEPGPHEPERRSEPQDSSIPIE